MKKALSTFCALLLSTAALFSCAETPQDDIIDTERHVGVTIIVDNVGDLSYNDGIISVLKKMEERYNDPSDILLSVSVFSMETGSENEREELRSAFSGDGELIIIANQIAMPVLEPAIAYHPEKKFILIDMEATGVNIYSAIFKPFEAAYLCGFLAAKMTETGIIGIVIGMDIPALHDFAVGYIQGALAADPDCKVILSTVGNFHDAKIGYALAEQQFEQGADVCFGVAGGAGLGCLQAARDYGRYAIGVDIDQTLAVEPDIAEVILTSCMKNFDMLTSIVLDEYLTGKLSFGQSGHFGLTDGAVGIARNQNYLAMVPQDVQTLIDEQEEMIITGRVVVRSAYDMTQAQIEEIISSVKP